MTGVVRQIKTLAIIPARKGSKRLPRKNVLPLAGKPLIRWSIDEALDAPSVDMIVVTSDDEEVLSIANAYQSQRIVSLERPAALATDTASSVDVVIHSLLTLEARGFFPERVVLLQPTSPLRSAADIEGAIRLFMNTQAENVISVCELDHPTAWCGTVDEHAILSGIDLSVARSQDTDKEYRLNGAIYIALPGSIKEKKKLVFGKPKVFIMDKASSLDIDDYFGFKQCEFFLTYRDNSRGPCD